MSETKLAAIIFSGFFVVYVAIIGTNIYGTKKTNELIKYAIDKGANISLSK